MAGQVYSSWSGQSPISSCPVGEDCEGRGSIEGPV